MRWFGYKTDPIAGGTTFDDVDDDPAALLEPDVFVPVESAQVEPGDRSADRSGDVRNRRANSQPVKFAADPRTTFTSKAWTLFTRDLVRKGMGGSISTSGVAPAAIQSSIQMAQSGNLPAIQVTIVREDQVDRTTGNWINELTFNFPADGEGTVEGNLMGLFHQVDDVADLVGFPDPAGMPDYVDAFMLRDIIAIDGDGVGTQIGCLGGFGWTLRNGLSEDFQTRYCAGKNVWEVTVDGKLRRIQYPDRNKLGAQSVTGRLDFGSTQPDRELQRIVGSATKLVVELYGYPLGTTPDADEMLRLVFYKKALTGGGADPLAREGDQRSSYEFEAYVDDATGKDLEAIYVGEAALT